MSKSLEEAIKSLTARNDDLSDYLEGKTSVATRVANAPSVSLNDATERARKYWDKLEAEQKAKGDDKRRTPNRARSGGS